VLFGIHPADLGNVFEEALSSSVKAAGSWLTMSILPMTFPWAYIGTTISDFVSIEHDRYQGSRSRRRQ
jgi:hypothetical protein